MAFPSVIFENAADYWSSYSQELNRAAQTVDGDDIEKAVELIAKAISKESLIFVCGNGGSAAVASHLVCDHNKGIRTDTALRPRVICLNDNVPSMTAISNDMAYARVFDYQLSSLANNGDLLVTISSSGDSDNIVSAIRWANENQVSTIALTGFSGGRSSKLADLNIHVDSQNYGVIEDTHQSIMHVFAQFLRHGALLEKDVASTNF
jgi:D-sedoheptulose 7-phosphate isomerase